MHITSSSTGISAAKPPLRPISQLPGPKGLPLLGNLLQIKMEKLHLILEDWAGKYGPIYRFKLANKIFVALSEPEVIQKILRERPHTFRRISSIERVAREMGMLGVFAAEGEQWQRHRRLTMAGFNPEYLRSFFPSLITITERLHRRWDKLAATQAPLDILEDWMRYTVDVTTALAFGYDMNTLEQEGDRLQHHLQSLFPVFNRRALFPFPYWHYFKLPSDRALDRSLVAIRATIREFIQRSHERLAQHPTLAAQPSNFLEALLSAQDTGTIRFNDHEIFGNILTILLGGEDTTAHSLSWLMYLLTEHPEAQHLLQQEVDRVLGDESMPRELGILEQLRYTEAVIHESMRLKSVSPLLFTEPITDVEISGVAIPKGTVLMLIKRFGALQEEHFSNARAFRPERWLETSPQFTAHNRNASTSFGAGPRFCPGRNLAILEMKTAMAMVAKNFEFTRVDTGKPVEEVFSFAMMPRNLSIRFNPR